MRAALAYARPCRRRAAPRTASAACRPRTAAARVGGRAHLSRAPPRVRLCAAERMLVVLRDGRKIIGVMRSFDQFANIVLEQATERIIFEKQFADVPLGLYVIRGENVVLLGQMVRAAARSHPLPLSLPWLSSAAADAHARFAGRGQGCEHNEPAAERGARRGGPRRQAPRRGG